LAKEIKEELKTFKEKLNGKLSSISSSTGEIVSKINSLAQESTSTKGLVEANYQSSTEVNQAASKLAATAEFLQVISSDITSTVNGAVSKANDVISKVNNLETLLADIKSIESRISSENAKEKPDSGVLSSERSKLASKEAEFDTVQEEAMTALAALKAMDKTVNVSSGNASGSGTNTGTDTNTQNAEDGKTGTSTLDTYSGYLQNLKYGTFTKSVYNSKYGKLNYYIYVPDNAQNIQGLPLMLYLHGGNSHNNGWGSCTEYGLAPKIRDRQVNPQGIVICPLITDFEGGAGQNCLNAAMELTNSVANQYHCDKNRISLVGHSYGAIVGYKLINQYPNYFSAFVPISGWNEVTSAFKNVKVWAFHGDRDNRGGGSRTTYPGALKALEQIKAIGGQAQMSTLKGMGHSHVQNKTLEQTFLSPDGKQETYLEWAMRQRKA